MRKKPLTQWDIDHGAPLPERRPMTWREALEYVDAPSGGVLTIAVIVAVILGLVVAWKF